MNESRKNNGQKITNVITPFEKKLDILSIILGLILIAGSLILFEYVFALFYVSHSKEEGLNEILSEKNIYLLPLTYYIILICFNILTAFIAGMLPVVIGSEQLEYSTIIGVFATLFSILNNYLTPFPVWYNVVSTLIFIPSCYLGGFFLKRIFIRTLIVVNFFRKFASKPG